ITFLVGLVFGGVSYQAVRTIKKHMSNQRSQPNFRIQYRPSPPLSSSNKSSPIRIRIVEEPLTAQNFSTIISALTELHTKCWLIVKNRFGDLIAYTQTRNLQFSEEAHLVIERMAHNSPLELKLNPGVKEIAEALGEAIDAV